MNRLSRRAHRPRAGRDALQVGLAFTLLTLDRGVARVIAVAAAARLLDFEERRVRTRALGVDRGPGCIRTRGGA